jgi:formate C-acetyltransferase
MQPGGRGGLDWTLWCSSGSVPRLPQGKDMQYFGARANLPKLLLYTLNQVGS